MTTALESTDTKPSTRNAALPVVLHPRVVTGVGGGPDKTILNSPRFLKELGYHGICAYLRPPGDAGFAALRARAAEAEATLVEIDDAGAWDVRVVWRMLRVCRETKLAIWHGHDYKTNRWASCSAVSGRCT